MRGIGAIAERLLRPKRTGVMVRARYADLGSLETALRTLQRSPYTDYEAYGPTCLAELAHLMPRRRSPVRAIATVGGITGCIGGLALALWSSSIYGLVVGGKPPLALLPIVIVGFEASILLACIATFLATGHHARLLPVAPPGEYDERYSEDVYGLHVRCAAPEADRLAALLREAGAQAVDEP